MYALWLAQAPDLVQRFGDIAQYITTVGVIALVIFAIRTETLLNHAERGLIRRVEQIGERWHQTNNQVVSHSGDIARNTEDITALEQDVKRLERRHMPRDTDADPRT